MSLLLQQKVNPGNSALPDEWRVSKYFLGGRYLKNDKYERFLEKKGDLEYLRKQFSYIFEEYIEKLDYDDREIAPLFIDYILQNFLFSAAQEFNFQKTSCFIEISYHLYNESFNKALPIEKSFDLLKKILVRHSLFRPPISIQVFDLSEIQAINTFLLDTFFRHYDMYVFANTPFINVEIRSFSMFKAKFPFTDVIADSKQIARTQIPLLQEYLIDKETGLTPEQLEEVMKGDDINLVPAKMREEWLKMKKERERQQKIDRVIQKEVERLNKQMEAKMEEQDEHFLEAVQNIKNPKKK